MAVQCRAVYLLMMAVGASSQTDANILESCDAIYLVEFIPSINLFRIIDEILLKIDNLMKIRIQLKI